MHLVSATFGTNLYCIYNKVKLHIIKKLHLCYVNIHTKFWNFQIKKNRYWRKGKFLCKKVTFEVLLNLIKKFYLHFVSIMTFFLSKSVTNHYKAFYKSLIITFNDLRVELQICAFIMLAFTSNSDKIRIQSKQIYKKRWIFFI